MTWIDFRDEERFKRAYKTLSKSKVKRRKITRFIRARLDELEAMYWTGPVTYRDALEHKILRSYDWKTHQVFLRHSISSTSLLREIKSKDETGLKKKITRFTYNPSPYEVEMFERRLSREVVDELVAQLKAL